MQELDHESVSVTGFGGEPTKYEFWLLVDDSGHVTVKTRREGDSLIIDWQSEACINQGQCVTKTLSPIAGEKTTTYDLQPVMGDSVDLTAETETGRDGVVTASLQGTYDGGGGGGGGGEPGINYGLLLVLAVGAYALYRAVSDE